MAGRDRGYQVVEHPGFGFGLNLRDGPDAIEGGGAIDALNVRFTERETLDVRPGFNLDSEVATGAATYPSHIMAFQQAGEERILVCAGVKAYVSGPTLSETAAADSSSSSGAWSSVRIGTPNTEHVYATNGDLVRRWTGSAWETCDGAGGRPHLGQPTLLGVTGEGRLVLAGFSAGDSLPTAIDAGIDADPALVCFSAAGDPTSYTASHFVRLRPGDGEQIMGVATWRELTFIFKESTFYVFPGTTPDADLQPVFNRRPVEGGIGMAARGAVCVARDGVYFLGERGIYRTQGGPPQLLSELVEPLLLGRTARYYLGGQLNRDELDVVRMHWHDEKLYVTFPAGSSTIPNRQLVLDTRFGWWSLYDLPAGAFTVMEGELVFTDTGGLVTDYGLWRHREEAVGDAEGSDAARSFLARWRSGWVDFDSSEVKTLAELKVWAAGVFFVKLACDFRASFEHSEPVDLGGETDTWGDGSGGDLWGDGADDETWASSQELDVALVRRAIRGTHFSFQFDGEVGQVDASTTRSRWSVHRVAQHLRELRHPTTMRADR